MKRRLYLFVAIWWIALSTVPIPLQAVDTTRVDVHAGDSVILFRFVPGRLMFYSPYLTNEQAIRQAAELLEDHRADIVSGKAVILVQGFCGSFGSKQRNLAAAKNRSNQVKSYFITLHGMKEDYYRTRNHTYSYKGIRDVVALLGLQYLDGRPLPVDTLTTSPELEEEPMQTAVADAAPVTGTDTVPPVPETVSAPVEEEPAAVSSAAVVEEPAPVVEKEYIALPVAIKTNMLYDALLMPSLEVEWRIDDRWSVNLEGTMAWWHNDHKHKYYQLATISLEGRYWFKTKKPWHGHYVGLFGGFAWYDLENGGRGYQGEGEFVGLSYGYMFPVGKYFSLEAGLGGGYLNAKYEEYLPVDGHYVYQQTSRTSYFGPLKLKLALVWRLGRWIEKKGGNR